MRLRPQRTTIRNPAFSGVWFTGRKGTGGTLVLRGGPDRREASVAGLSAKPLTSQGVNYRYNGPAPPACLLTKIRLGEAASVIYS